jgi:predicted secreted Zn-dependent protease
VNKIVEWVGYDAASPAAKAHWDTVLKNLKRHEKRHMDIAIEVGNDLAKLLIGHEVGSKPSIAEKTTDANTLMDTRQKEMDSPNESDHGRKKGHAYGDCNIDTSIQ